MPNTLRSCIIAEEGYTLISLDASQVELRALAKLSGDVQMLEDLATGDLHLATAIRMFGQCSLDEAPVGYSPEQAEEWVISTMKKRRYDAKQCNFAVVYGATAEKLAEMFGCSLSEAEDFMNDHREAYPQMYAWMEEQVEIAHQQGYTLNLFNRKRPLPELESPIASIREKAEREVVNTIIQGTAVDIVKLAMLVLRNNLLDPAVRMILQVHDEVVLEVPDEMVSDTLKSCDELANYFPDYPFKAAVGKNYGELKEVKDAEEEETPQ